MSTIVADTNIIHGNVPDLELTVLWRHGITILRIEHILIIIIIYLLE